MTDLDVQGDRRAQRQAERDAMIEAEAARRYRTNRLEAFSDGVFAIATTLLVLEIAVPIGTGDDLLSAIVAEWPSYLAYLVSFATIGAIWLGHSAITEYLNHVDGTFLRLNLILLLVVAFLPFPTRLLAEHITAADAERVAAPFYGLCLMLNALLLGLLWRYAVHARLIRPDIDDLELRLISRRLTPGVAGYGVLIVIGFVQPTIAVIGFLLIAIFLLIPIPLRGRPG